MTDDFAGYSRQDCWQVCKHNAFRHAYTTDSISAKNLSATRYPGISIVPVLGLFIISA